MTFIEGEGDVVTNLRLRDRLRLDHPFPGSEQILESAHILKRLREKSNDTFGGTNIGRFRMDSEIECEICGERWPVFQRRATKFEIIDVRTIRTFTTPLASETSHLDNSCSSVAARMSAPFELTWTERIEVSWERAVTAGTTTSMSLKGPVGAGEILARVDHRLEETLKDRFALASEKQQRSGKTIETTVPAGKTLLVSLEWKQVWNEIEYKLRLDGDNSRILLIPARHAITVSVDMVTQEL
ncbi:hypothetical protein [Streptomyces sp. NBC_00140]|uniref:hypothetical protein n=1 Tax=Streptomyces sp. NBC_00140 TaxID=2975664 RepID=UPI0022527078|nr:hypothetical protein [Streptomyces sp. NBC_00140]MCX5328132.1 hypothetical protein [Streptomyces sp. NBC_00140]